MEENVRQAKKAKFFKPSTTKSLNHLSASASVAVSLFCSTSFDNLSNPSTTFFISATLASVEVCDLIIMDELKKLSDQLDG